MVEETRPTNERILALLEAISRQLGEIREEQGRLAAEFEEVVKARG